MPRLIYGPPYQCSAVSPEQEIRFNAPALHTAIASTLNNVPLFFWLAFESLLWYYSRLPVLTALPAVLMTRTCNTLYCFFFLPALHGGTRNIELYNSLFSLRHKYYCPFYGTILALTSLRSRSTPVSDLTSSVLSLSAYGLP